MGNIEKITSGTEILTFINNQCGGVFIQLIIHAIHTCRARKTLSLLNKKSIPVTR